MQQKLSMDADDEPTEGFDRSDLQAANVLEYKSIKPCDLTNPIHPIFHHSNFIRSNFVRPSRQIYKRITPALRLASLFITNDECLGWWCTLLLGQVKTDQTTQKQVLKAVTPTPSSLRKTRQALIEHADYVKFAFSTKKHDHFAETIDGPCNVDEDPTTLIRLHRGFLDSIVDEYSSFSLCHQLRFQFFFALNLVHELAHSVYWLLSDGEEPHFAIDEPLAELGASWEYSVFGGKIQPINLKTVSADSGLMAYEWQTEEASDAAGGKVFCALPMEYISSFFSRKRWELVEIFGIGQLNAPMEAACKSYYPLTTDHPDLYEDDE